MAGSLWDWRNENDRVKGPAFCLRPDARDSEDFRWVEFKELSFSGDRYFPSIVWAAIIDWIPGYPIVVLYLALQLDFCGFFLLHGLGRIRGA
jgi:hypothetical protein